MTQLDRFRQALLQLDGEACALDQLRAKSVLAVINDLVTGVVVPNARLRALGRYGAELSRSRITYLPNSVGKGELTAVVPVTGTALYNFEFQPYCFSTRLLAQTISELGQDKKIARVVLLFNTPGGAVTGTAEAADAILAMRTRKPIFGIVDPLCASAGYWLASQCTKLIAVPSSDIGSIGVFMMHVDVSVALAKAGIKPTFIKAGEFKTEGNSYEPLSDNARTFFQGEVDVVYRDFLSAVARGRNTSAATVKLQFGGGRCLNAKDALRIGMIDAVERPDLAMNSICFGRYSNIGAMENPQQAVAVRRRRRIALEEASLV